jgi:hypothetical protein
VWTFMQAHTLSPWFISVTLWLAAYITPCLLFMNGVLSFLFSFFFSG